ncbi:hypothetical protein ONA70_13405 [Micromonospora yasonensis]|uniref:hypothetical protein n=1 Tax=Micromonospora yasonensis TaxID=1128667 RepID=UPI00222F6EC2|nr:hypothetical protein [Micromonospora yasonensis]MCW3841099.1 hypothetical protein [Micromonospora yasonensis]
MSSFPKPGARVKAVLAAVAAVAALVALLAWHPAGVLSVALALLCVVLAMITGVAVSAARQAGDDPPAEQRPDGYEVDTDPLESFDPRTPPDPRRGGHELDADTLDALDPREVRENRRVTGLSDR